MRRLHAALLFLGVAFLACLVWSVGGDELWRELRALGWGVLPLIACEGLANLAHTAGWRHCVAPRQRGLSLYTLFRMAMAGFSISYLIPSASLGGEVAKAALLSSNGNSSESVSSVVLDKFCLAFAHVLLLVPGSLLVLCMVDLEGTLRAAMVVGALMLTIGICGFMLVQRHGKLGAVLRWLAARGIGGRALHKTAQNVSAVDEKLKAFYRERPRHLLWAIAWHLVGHAVTLLQTWLFFQWLNVPVLLSSVVCAGFICLWFDLLTFVVPLNLGTLEGSRTIALKAVGYSAVQGMAYGVALRLAQIFWAGFGLVSYALLTRRQRSSRVGAERIAEATLRHVPTSDKSS